MRKVFESISDFILPAVVFIAITAILTGTALFSKMGQRMQEEKEDFSNFQDAGAIKEICEREEPVIVYTGKKVFQTGESISVGTLFTATEGSGISVEVEEITNEAGEDVMGNYDENIKTVSFSQRGIYTFTIYTMDHERKAASRKFSIAVDSRTAK